MNPEKIKQMISAHPGFFRFGAKLYNHLILKNKLHAKGVTLSYGVALMNGLKVYSYGADNEIIIGDLARIQNSSISIHGSHNRIYIGDLAYLNQVELYMEDNCNEISIGKHTYLFGETHLAAIEGTKIQIGQDCMLAIGQHFRTGDSHSVLDLEGKRINPSQDIVIGDHVWVGAKVTCLKGVYVAPNCIVAATTTLCKQHPQEHCVIAGVPGKVVKTGVDWCMPRIKIED